jgi:uncharacterized protein (DUF58 family)
MRIAKPLLLVITPIGVGWGLIEAARFHWWLAVLMGVLLGVISLFVWSVVWRIGAEREADKTRISAERQDHAPP